MTPQQKLESAVEKALAMCTHPVNQPAYKARILSELIPLFQEMEQQNKELWELREAIDKYPFNPSPRRPMELESDFVLRNINMFRKAIRQALTQPIQAGN